MVLKENFNELLAGMTFEKPSGQGHGHHDNSNTPSKGPETRVANRGTYQIGTHGINDMSERLIFGKSP